MTLGSEEVLARNPARRQERSTGLAIAGVDCPACGQPVEGAAREVPDHEYALDYVARYAHCASCHSAFQAPMPLGEQLSAFYPAAYHSVGRRGFLARLRNQLRLRKLAPLLDGEGALLDYGCGDGSFLVHAAQALPDRHFYGFEIDSQPSLHSLADGRVTLIRGSYEYLLQTLPECRLITMNHVIEHLPDPLSTLLGLREKLLPGGRLEGQTPAAASLEHRVFGSRWSGYHAPRHTVVFSRNGLARLLERAGLTEIAIRGAFNPAGIAVSLATLRQKQSAPGSIVRRGPSWLFWLGLATSLAPIDLLSGAPGIIDFRAKRA